MATLDTTTTYTLTNAYTGRTKLLSISLTDNTSPQILTFNNTLPPENAQWFLTPTDTPPFYRLHTRSHEASLSLDVINTAGASGSASLRLADTGHFSGQYWRFDLWPTEEEGTDGHYYRLSNNFTGVERCLDVYSDTLGVHLAAGGSTGEDGQGKSGQWWRVEVVGGGDRMEGEGGEEKGPGKGGLSTGAIVGVSIGGVAAVGVLVLVVIWVVMRSRRRRAWIARGGMGKLGDVKTQANVYVESAPAELATGLYPAARELPAGPIPSAELPKAQIEFTGQVRQ